jgi:hypothetical protein
MSSKKNQQHIVPRTYLKHWCISENERFMFVIDFSNKYNTSPQRVGPNDKLFKREKYYNSQSFTNPYGIEDMLGEDIEPNYEIIMTEVKAEGKISQSVREKIIGWLHVSKMRSPVMRDNPERIANFLLKTQERWGGKLISAAREREIEEYSKGLAKNVHLRGLSDIKQVEEIVLIFVNTLLNKRWVILKSNPLFEFWTNDNPGFSPNVIERFAAQRPYHHVMEMNAGSIIYYPLSPKYCLEISPFEAGTPLEVNATTIEIEFKEASLHQIDFINRGVFYTRSKLLISNNKEILERCIK